MERDCPICGERTRSRLQSTPNGGGDYDYTYHYNCPRCGIFSTGSRFDKLAYRDNEYLGSIGSRMRANLSAWLRERTDRGGIPPHFNYSFLLKDKISELRDAFKAVSTPAFTEKANKLLQTLDNASEYAGQKITVFATDEEYRAWEARVWAQNKKEFDTIVNHLVAKGLVDGDRGSHDRELILNLFLTGEGLQRAEELNQGHSNSSQGFVAMWFDDEVWHLYDDVMVPAISDAKYNPFKINDNPTIERVDARIEEEIRKSRFVVADLTGHRPSVYFEAGFARALGIPVIYTCRSDHFKDLSFDIRQFHVYEWSRDNLDPLVSEVQKAIIRNCGRGPLT